MRGDATAGSHSAAARCGASRHPWARYSSAKLPQLQVRIAPGLVSAQITQTSSAITTIDQNG
jgi:hypothetical protein